MKIEINNNVFLSIDDDSFGLLSVKMDQMRALERFKKARLKHFDKLTPREKQILKLLAEGNNNPGIASLLDISRRTVENHRKSINRKLHIRHCSICAFKHRMVNRYVDPE